MAIKSCRGGLFMVELNKVTIAISNPKEELNFALEVRATTHAINRWYCRECCDSTQTKNLISELATFIENNKKIQESLCSLYADGDYNVLTKQGYPIGFQQNHIFYVTNLKEDGLVIVTTHNLVSMRREFNMKPGEYYFDSDSNLKVS